MEKTVKSELFSWIQSLLFALAIVFISYQFLFVPTKVQGESMLPTFEDKNRIIVSKVSTIDRFDMIVFDAPNATEKYIKRVIGVPGDRIEMIDDILHVNGKVYDEPYVKRIDGDPITDRITGDFTLKEITGQAEVPEGAFFVLGDHRLKSNDSRFFGFIYEDAVIGEVKLRYYPFTAIGIPK
ncbi:signal peptidase I [Sporosarcina sp. ANT_H38]|uniref:signal peptidase I n=1 Tax=Sporosarcina sp. ANT_H38 TaxID=2597358 RepID=UPI0011F23720|nr:signal peptidase I [Sporosarcina sp. ANT_H38]KAA0941021.1 signal peptidase I [Sporosarcina sp. ANT_H38]